MRRAGHSKTRRSLNTMTTRSVMTQSTVRAKCLEEVRAYIEQKQSIWISRRSEAFVVLQLFCLEEAIADLKLNQTSNLISFLTFQLKLSEMAREFVAGEIKRSPNRWHEFSPTVDKLQDEISKLTLWLHILQP